MTNKVQAIVTAWIAGISAFIAQLFAMSPEQQTTAITAIIDFIPVQWRPTMVVVSRFIASGSIIYGIYRASHSGPQTPPKNPPTQ